MLQFNISKRDKIAFIIFACIIVICILKIAGCYNSIHTIDVNQKKSSSDSIHVYFSKKSKEWITEKQSLLIEVKELKSNNEALYKRLKQINIKPNNLYNYNKISSIVHDTIIAVLLDTFTEFITTKGDTLETIPFSYADKWLTLNGYVKKNNAVIEYKSVSDIEIISSYRKNGFLKPKSIVVMAIDKNPNAKIKDIQSLTIYNKPKWYQTKGFAFASGVITGSLATTLTIIYVK